MSAYQTRHNYTGDRLAGLLGKEIDTYSQGFLALGSTEAGRAWVMKAMNPSWPGVCVGMPDRTSSNIVMYNFEQSFLVEPPTGAIYSATDLWNFEINLHNHPICIADIIGYQQSAPQEMSFSRTVLNSQLPNDPANLNIPANGSTFWPTVVARDTQNMLYKTQQWYNMVQHARLCFAGFTLTQSAGSTSDQGLEVAGQQAQTPIRTTVADTINGQFIGQDYFGAEDFGTFDNLTNLPRTLTGASRDGVYLPLKLDDDFSSFKSQVTPVSTTSALIGLTGAVTATSQNQGYTASPHQFISILNGSRGIQTMGSYMGQILLRGIPSSTSFMVRVRMGFEVKPFAGASNTPFIMESPRYDQQALDMYSALMLEVEMDAYIANYNLFEWLGNAIRKVAPYIQKAIPWIKSAASGAISGFGSGGIEGAALGALGGLGREAAGRLISNVKDNMYSSRGGSAPNPNYAGGDDGEYSEPPAARKRQRMIEYIPE